MSDKLLSHESTIINSDTNNIAEQVGTAAANSHGGADNNKTPNTNTPWKESEPASQVDLDTALPLEEEQQQQQQENNNNSSTTGAPSFFLIDSGVSITSSPRFKKPFSPEKQQQQQQQVDDEYEETTANHLESLKRPLLPTLDDEGNHNNEDTTAQTQGYSSSYFPPSPLSNSRPWQRNNNMSSTDENDQGGLRHRDVLWTASSSSEEIQFEQQPEHATQKQPYEHDSDHGRAQEQLQIKSHNNNTDNDETTSTVTQPHVHRHIPWYKNPYQRMAMVSNFGTSYNVVNISLVLPIIEQVLLAQTGQETSSQDASSVASSLLAGMILGQLMGGALGDSRLGLAGSLRLVMVLQIAASLGSALWVQIPPASHNDNPETVLGASGTNIATQVYATLSLWRFVLGVGAGAVYPLAACLSVEQPGLGRGVDHHCPPTSSGHPVNSSNNNNNHPNDNDDEPGESEELFRDEEGGEQQQHDNAQQGTSANDANTNNNNNNSAALKRVVRTFAVQGIGFWCVPALAWPLLKWPGISLNATWRLLLGLGALPGMVLLFLQWRLYRKDHEEQEAHKQQLLLGQQQQQQQSSQDGSGGGTNEDPSGLPSAHSHSSGLHRAGENNIPENEFLREDSDGEVGTFLDSAPDLSSDGCYGESEPPAIRHGWWASLWLEPNLCQKLLGTAGAWFLFDVLFYGNTLFQPIVVEAAFGPVAQSSTSSDLALLQRTARDSLLLTSMALPGYFVVGAVLGEKTCGKTQSVRFVMLQGFAFMSMLYLAIGVYWKELRHYPIALVLLYGMTFFFANYGPNTTTFILPSLVYSAECRSTLNGLSAAAGKLGALTGATLFAPAAAKFGDATVMKLCAIIGFVAYIMTLFFVRIPSPDSSSANGDNGDASTRSTRMMPYAHQQQAASTATLPISNTQDGQHPEEVIQQHPDVEQRQPLAAGSLT